MSAAGPPLADVTAEARRIVEFASHGALPVRVLGGVGVTFHDHVPIPESLRRDYGDIDIVVPAKSSRATSTALVAMGYEPNERFNALHGARRMLFYDTANQRQLDVFVGIFAMCHELDLDRRLTFHAQALDAADLLLTKLQIAEINRKDIVDATRLVLTHEVVETPTGAAGSAISDVLSLARLRQVTAADWGWYTTFTDNLALVRASGPELLTEESCELVTMRIDTLATALEEAPKSMRWRARSVVGRRAPWYELPEEVDRGASR